MIKNDKIRKFIYYEYRQESQFCKKNHSNKYFSNKIDFSSVLRVSKAKNTFFINKNLFQIYLGIKITLLSFSKCFSRF